MANRIVGLDGNVTGGNGGKPTIKEEFDARKQKMRMEQVGKAREILHKRMMEEIQKMVPEWRKAVCRRIFPQWLSMFLMGLLQAFPPQSLMLWAIKPSGIHPAYRMAMLLPLVVPGTIIRMFIGAPLQWLQTHIYLIGIKTDLKPVNEFTNEMTITQRGGETRIFTQDWRYGDVTLRSSSAVKAEETHG